MLDLNYLIQIVILSLIVSRISFMLVEEEGFLGIAYKIRKLFGVRYKIDEKFLEDSEIDRFLSNGFGFHELIPYTPNNLARLITCYYCTSMWVSLILSVFFANGIIDFFILSTSVAGMAIIVGKKAGYIE